MNKICNVFEFVSMRNRYFGNKVSNGACVIKTSSVDSGKAGHFYAVSCLTKIKISAFFGQIL